MLRFFKPASTQLEEAWREVRRRWLADAVRRQHEDQLFALKHAAMLGQCELWLAWENAPPENPPWTGPHYCLGIVAMVEDHGTLIVQVMAGRQLKRWAPLVAKCAEMIARQRNLRIELYCRKGWKQEFSSVWKMPVAIYRDLERIRVYPDPDARLARAAAHA